MPPKKKAPTGTKAKKFLERKAKKGTVKKRIAKAVKATAKKEKLARVRAQLNEENPLPNARSVSWTAETYLFRIKEINRLYAYRHIDKKEHI